MASIVLVETRAALVAYTTTTDTLYWNDEMRGGIFWYHSSGYTVDEGIVFPGTSSGFWVRQYEGDILPQWFEITNGGWLNDKSILDNWMGACKTFNKAVHFPEGTYCLPIDFQYDFGDFDLTIKGVKNKSIITSLNQENGDTKRNSTFAIPAKLDITKAKPADGVYQIDVIGDIHLDFSGLSSPALGNYLEIVSGAVSDRTLPEIKAMGYITEIDINAGDPDAGSTEYDGLYVVASHSLFSYGGGFAHLELQGVLDFDTNGKSVLYVQGTILIREGKIWSRYYSGSGVGETPGSSTEISGGGFGTTGNFIVKDVCFDDIRFYLFSPFNLRYPTVNGQTSDIFSISGCKFKNCPRVISSMTYGGVDNDKTWFQMSVVYENFGQFRFRNFCITDNDFSYIHQSICWAAPPSLKTIITDNSIHDCYTLAVPFNLLMTADDSAYWLRRITQTVTDNSFINVRPLNIGANSTLCLIRTTGAAVVNNNTFLDVTQQTVYISGSNSTFNGNTVTRFIDDDPAGYTEYPVMLAKLIDDLGMVEISGNTIISPLSSLVEMEGNACFNITGNTFIGFTKTRYITPITKEINPARIYLVKDFDKFAALVDDNYDHSSDHDEEIVPEVYVYFNKRRNTWVKLRMPGMPDLPYGYIFSRVDELEFHNQHITIEGNALLECETITHLSSGTSPTPVLRSVSVLNNTIRYCTNLHMYTNVTVEEYICSGNYFRSSSIEITAGTNELKTLSFRNNTIAKGLAPLSLWAYQDLFFVDNLFVADEDYNSDLVYEAFDLDTIGGTSPAYIPTSLGGVFLTGAELSKITVEGNHFINTHSRLHALVLVNPFRADVRNNVFDMNDTANLISTAFYRCAVRIDNPNVDQVTALLFTDNTIFVQLYRDNVILEFDENDATIKSILVDNNKVPMYPDQVIATIRADYRSADFYYRGRNFYESYKDTFGSGPTVIDPV